MKNPNKKKKTISSLTLMLVSEEAMVGALNNYVAARLALDERQAAHNEKIAALNAAFDTEVQDLRERIGGLEGSLHLFALSNKDKLFAEPKSRKYANATLGFALNPTKVEKRIKEDTFEAIAQRLETVEWGDPYVSYKGPILEKEALLRDRAELTEEQQAMAGIRFEQGERFYIEITVAPNAETVAVPTATTVAA